MNWRESQRKRGNDALLLFSIYNYYCLVFIKPFPIFICDAFLTLEYNNNISGIYRTGSNILQLFTICNVFAKLDREY